MPHIIITAIGKRTMRALSIIPTIAITRFGFFLAASIPNISPIIPNGNEYMVPALKNDKKSSGIISDVAKRDSKP